MLKCDMYAFYFTKPLDSIIDYYIVVVGYSHEVIDIYTVRQLLMWLV
jgi:hypothetical protein